MAEYSYTTHDGGLVAIVTGHEVGATSVTTRLGTTSRRRASIVTSPPPTADHLATDPNVSTGIDWLESYDIGQGRLDLGSGGQPTGSDQIDHELDGNGNYQEMRVVMGIWRGSNHTLHSMRRGGEVATILEVFTALDIVEDSFGIRAVPLDQDAWFFREPSQVMADVVGRGSIMVSQMTKERAAAVPRHAGTAVVSGDLYRAPSADEGEPDSFFIVNEAVFASFLPYHGSSELDVADFLEYVDLRLTLP